MLKFNFEYENHTIVYSIDLLGREICQVDGVQVEKSSTAGMKSLVEMNFEIDGEKFKIYRKLLSLSGSEYQVTLTNEHRIVEKQTKTYFAQEMGMVKEAEYYKNDERQWVQEILPPQRIFITAFVLYLFTVLVSIGERVSSVFELQIEPNTWLVVAVIATILLLAYALTDIFKTLQQAFSAKAKLDSPIATADEI